jgi:sugar phosphate isomerase/epimerase
MAGTMNVGIGQFSYHRYFGDLTHGEADPGVRWGLADFLEKARSYGVDTVSLQTCYLSPREIAHFPEITAPYGLNIILEWGHPDGLQMGLSQAAVEDLRVWIERAEKWTHPLLRIVAGYPNFRGQEPVDTQIKRLVPIVNDLCTEAMERGVTLAIENHADFSPAELRKLIAAVSAPNLRAVLDFGNAVRVGANLIQSIRTLVSAAQIVHLRDLVVLPESQGNPQASWPTAPLGGGSLDINNALYELYHCGFTGCLLLELSHLHDPWAGQEDVVLAHNLRWLENWVKSFSNE